MRLSMKRHRAAGPTALLAVAALAVLTACGGSDSDSSTESSDSGTGSPSPAAEATVNDKVAEKYPACETHMQDGDTAKVEKFTNVRGTKYSEISFVCGPGVASMYNTTSMNNPENPGAPIADTADSTPLDVWNQSTQDSLADEFEVPSVLKNGPRFWTNDWITLPVGPTMEFDGLYARWFAYPAYPPGISKLFGNPKGSYSKSTIGRDSKFGFYKGTNVYVLIDPDGNPYVMQAGSSAYNVGQTIEDLEAPDYASKLDIPDGWKYKVIKLTKPLTVYAVDGSAVVTTDAVYNTYDSCTEPSTAACSYNPLTGK